MDHQQHQQEFQQQQGDAARAASGQPSSAPEAPPAKRARVEAEAAPEAAEAAGAAGAAGAGAESPEPVQAVPEPAKRTLAEEYFKSYAQISIHEEMLRDHARTGAFRNAIMRFAQDFEGKVVLDVGCGTGILSLFAVEAGARKVYAVDASEIVEEARKIFALNQVEDKIVAIRGEVETVILPEKVDVIISEWMGYFLFYESMLESVIVARDRFLKPGGLMFPSEAKLYLAPFSDENYQNRTAFWSNVYGWDFSCIVPFATKCHYEEPQVESFPPQYQMSLLPSLVTVLDCHTVTIAQIQQIESQFTFNSTMIAPLHGFVAWFDVTFKGSVCQTHLAPVSTQAHGQVSLPTITGNDAETQVVLSTSPEAGYTHWKQTMFYYDESVLVRQDQEITGSIAITNHGRSKRSCTIDIQYKTGTASVSKRWEML
eukprot:m51a1_g280 putative arginine n-methyltransferase 6 (428) ;mRNA; f:273560-275540